MMYTNSIYILIQKIQNFIAYKYKTPSHKIRGALVLTCTLYIALTLNYNADCDQYF